MVQGTCVFFCKENLEEFKRSAQKWGSHVTQCTVPLQHRRLMRSGFQYITWTKLSEVIIIAVEANPRVPIHLSRIPSYFPLFCTHPFHTSLPPWMDVTQAGYGSDIIQMLRSLCAKASMKGTEKCPTKHHFSTQGWNPQRINSHHNSSNLNPQTRLFICPLLPQAMDKADISTASSSAEQGHTCIIGNEKS